MSDPNVDLKNDRMLLRRDFIQGVAVGLGGLAVGCHGHLIKNPKKEGSELVRPSVQNELNLKGQTLSESERGHFVRDGGHRQNSFRRMRPLKADEAYDLIVVGAGATGLAAACRYKELKGPEAKILIIENSSEPGGHARRNTFMYQGKPYIAAGGAYAIEDFESSPEETHGLFRYIGLNPEDLRDLRDDQAYLKPGLSTAVLIDPKITGARKLEWLNGFHEKPYDELFARSSLTDSAKKELITLYSTRKNYLEGEKDAEYVLKNYTWKKFIKEKMGLGDLSVSFANMYATDLLGLGADCVSAEHARHIGPGFYGIGGDGFSDRNGVLSYDYNPEYRFPDGTFTLIKMMLKKLNTRFLSGSGDLAGVFSGEWNVNEFDRPDQNIRLRTSSMVTNVRHSDSGEKVQIEFMKDRQNVGLASANAVVLSSWGCVSKHIVPELSETQRNHFNDYQYTSALYINVLLNNWRPFLRVGAHKFFLPDGFCTWMQLSDPLRIGNYQPAYHPDYPVILNMYKYMYDPELGYREQMTTGRMRLMNQSFDSLEREIRQELNRIFGPWGFRDSRDISGIMINRWAHGYNFFNHPTQREQTYENARKPLGRISFAGTDSGGEAWLQAGISQAYRAVSEQSANLGLL